MKDDMKPGSTGSSPRLFKRELGVQARVVGVSVHEHLEVHTPDAYQERMLENRSSAGLGNILPDGSAPFDQVESSSVILDTSLSD